MQDEQQASESRTDWAEDRTNWAEDRTLQANERTFAGWMRTGLGSVGVAIGLQAVFGKFEPTWAAKSVASIFIVIALVLFWSARRNACATFGRLSDHSAEPLGRSHFTTIASLMALGAIGTGCVLWAL